MSTSCIYAQVTFVSQFNAPLPTIHLAEMKTKPTWDFEAAEKLHITRRIGNARIRLLIRHLLIRTPLRSA
jgi:hypothetical protein